MTVDESSLTKKCSDEAPIQNRKMNGEVVATKVGFQKMKEMRTGPREGNLVAINQRSCVSFSNFSPVYKSSVRAAMKGGPKNDD